MKDGDSPDSPVNPVLAGFSRIALSAHEERKLSIPIQPLDEHVLEVKFDEILPGYMKNILTKQELIQSAFSKYYLGRMTLQNYTR